MVHRLDAINAWTACMDAAGQPHDLLVVCTQCGTVAELSDPELSRQLASKVADVGFELSGHETELSALCGAYRRHTDYKLEERIEGKRWGSTSQSRWSPYT